MYLRKPVLEHMRMENVSFGHHLGHPLGMNAIKCPKLMYFYK